MINFRGINFINIIIICDNKIRKIIMMGMNSLINILYYNKIIWLNLFKMNKSKIKNQKIFFKIQ